MFRPLLINGVRDTYTEALGDEWSDSSGEGVKYYIVCSHMHTVSVRSTGTHCCSDHHGILQPYCLNHANNGQDNRQTTNRQQADYRYTTGRQHCYTHTITSEINVSFNDLLPVSLWCLYTGMLLWLLLSVFYSEGYSCSLSFQSLQQGKYIIRKQLCVVLNKLSYKTIRSVWLQMWKVLATLSLKLA